MNFGEWQFCNIDEQCSPLLLHAGELRFASSRARGRPGVALARLRLRRGFLALPWLPYKALESSPFFFSFALFSSRHLAHLRRARAVTVVLRHR